MVTIRQCRTDDVADVLAFLDKHWKPGHIFTTHRALFDWQHALPDRPGEYSIALARRATDDALLGILGYIPTRRFDASLGAHNTIWLALWKVRDDAESAGLGLKLLNHVTASEPNAAIGVIGFQAEVRPIYQALGFRVGELRHYAMPNPDVDHFELATLGARRPLLPDDAGLTATPIDSMHFAERVSDLDLGMRHAQDPAKTAEYFLERYLRHPVYRYSCDLISRDSAPIGLLTTRIATHAGRRALRIIDYLGPDEAVAGLGSIVRDQLRSAGAEYADVYNAGIDADLFRRAGFLEVDPEGLEVVPDHFEPFEARNVRIRFAIKSSRPVVLFKGDGDQDRPSQMPL